MFKWEGGGRERERERKREKERERGEKKRGGKRQHNKKIKGRRSDTPNWESKVNRREEERERERERKHTHTHETTGGIKDNRVRREEGGLYSYLGPGFLGL